MDPQTEPRLLVLVAAIGVSAVGAGGVIAHGHTIYVASAGIIALLVILAFQAPGPLAALLLLAAMNGIPIVSLGHPLPGGLKVDDVAAFGLAALLFAYQDRHPSKERARIVHIATMWSACFVAWWLYQFARTSLLDGVPWLKAALFGRDFLYFAILLPLALRARLPARSLRAGGMLLLAGVTLCAIGQDVQSSTGASLSWLVHPAIIDTTSGFGLTRLYSSMSPLINTGLIFAAALLLSKGSRGRRWPISALVVLYFIDAAVELTRANYFALGIGLLVAVGLYAVRNGSLTNVVLRVATIVAVLSVAALAVSAVAGSRSVPVVHSVISRASSGLPALVHSTGTVGYREQLDGSMLDVLRHKWPIGLGFLHPAARYVSALPGGTIRNSDTGVFNALMTMGIVGVLLIYAPLAYGLGQLGRASRHMRQAAESVPPWVFYGGAAWIGWALAGSPTLIVLFSVPGLIMSALALAALGHIITEPNKTLAVDQRQKLPQP